MKEMLFGETPPSMIEDPFKSDCIESIRMRATKGLFDNSFKFKGSVDFQNGDTEGTQNFEAKNFGELFTKIQEFCIALEKKHSV